MSNEKAPALTTASATGTRKVKLLKATPIDGEDCEPGEVVSVDSNVALDLIGSGMAEDAEPQATAPAPGKMFKTGEREPHVQSKTEAAAPQAAATDTAAKPAKTEAAAPQAAATDTAAKPAKTEAATPQAAATDTAAKPQS